MSTVQDVLDAIESIAPSRWCLPEDGSGFQVGDRGSQVDTAVVALDWSSGLADFAEDRGAQMIVAHHPAIYRPMARFTSDDLAGRFLTRLVRQGTAYTAAHTNWDAAPDGISDTMASLLGLQGVMPMRFGAQVELAKIVVFAPDDAAEAVIEAMSAAGAGVIGNYDRCSFVSEGTGSFRGLEGSNPFVGEPGRIERVPERRIEMRLPMSLAGAVSEAVRATHPYEEPAFDLYPLVPAVEMPLGRAGRLATPMSLADFATQVNDAFGSAAQVWGDPSKVISTVGVAGGAADEGFSESMDFGADAFVTGEVRQHVALEASEKGLAMLSCGHYHTEHPGCASLCRRLQDILPEIDWALFEPEPGKNGRPA